MGKSDHVTRSTEFRDRIRFNRHHRINQRVGRNTRTGGRLAHSDRAEAHAEDDRSQNRRLEEAFGLLESLCRVAGELANLLSPESIAQGGTLAISH